MIAVARRQIAHERAGCERRIDRTRGRHSAATVITAALRSVAHEVAIHETRRTALQTRCAARAVRKVVLEHRSGEDRTGVGPQAAARAVRRVRLDQAVEDLRTRRRIDAESSSVRDLVEEEPAVAHRWRCVLDVERVATLRVPEGDAVHHGRRRLATVDRQQRAVLAVAVDVGDGGATNRLQRELLVAEAELLVVRARREEDRVTALGRVDGSRDRCVFEGDQARGCQFALVWHTIRVRITAQATRDVARVGRAIAVAVARRVLAKLVGIGQTVGVAVGLTRVQDPVGIDVGSARRDLLGVRGAVAVAVGRAGRRRDIALAAKDRPVDCVVRVATERAVDDEGKIRPAAERAHGAALRRGVLLELALEDIRSARSIHQHCTTLSRGGIATEGRADEVRLGTGDIKTCAFVGIAIRDGAVGESGSRDILHPHATTTRTARQWERATIGDRRTHEVGVAVPEVDRATTRPLRASSYGFRPVAREDAVGEDSVAVVLRRSTAMRPTPSASVTRRDRGVVGERAAGVARSHAEHGAGAAPGPAVGVVASRQRTVAREAAIGEVELGAALGIDRTAAVVASALGDVVGKRAAREVTRAACDPHCPTDTTVGGVVTHIHVAHDQSRGGGKEQGAARYGATSAYRATRHLQ